jgi:GTP-binding protein
MKVISADYLQSATNSSSYPNKGITEIAFAGRSNVGKSSAINTLLGRKGLVSTSKTPGHTRKLNFFLINNSLIFTDLPGYGFAKVPLEVKKQWKPMVESYLSDRNVLAGVVVIVDSRRLPTDMDMELLAYLERLSIHGIVVATKADKLSRSAQKAQERAIERHTGARFPVVMFSSHEGTGKKELWKEIKNLIE